MGSGKFNAVVVEILPSPLMLLKPGISARLMGHSTLPDLLSSEQQFGNRDISDISALLLVE